MENFITEELETVVISDPEITKTSRKIGYVYETTDYSIFKSHDENRDIEQSLIKQIRTSMILFGWISGSIVVIDENGVIYDGAHRVQVAQENGIPVQYIIIKNPILNLISLLNSNKKVWTIMNHLKTYVCRDNQDYIEFMNFKLKYNEFTPTDAIMLCRVTTVSGNRRLFESGNFKMVNKDLTYEWAERLREIGQYVPFYNKGPFLRAMTPFFMKKNFVYEEFIKNLAKKADILKPHQSIKEYSIKLEDIYNHRRREKIRLR